MSEPLPMVEVPAAAIQVARLTNGGLRFYSRAADGRLRVLVEFTEAQARQLLANLQKALDA
jgi:hypothetical protein